MNEEKTPTLQRHVTAGPQALSAVSRLLGLSGGWRLEGLCGLGQENVRLSLASGRHKLVFSLLPKDSPDALLRAPRLSLGVEGEAGPAQRRFLEAALRRLKGRSLADILALLAADPDSFIQQVSEDRPGDEVRVPAIGQPMALLEDGWRNFYADQDFEVLLGVPQCFSHDTVNIQYADRECYYARPRRSFDKWTFLDWPEVAQEEDPLRATVDLGTCLVTELEEQDMVMGTGPRADALVAEVRRLAKAGKYLLFTHLCTPIIMGEDFQGLARRCQREVGGTTVSWSQKDRDELDNFGAHLRALLGRPGFFKGTGDRAAVNLFHFPAAYRREELIAFLKDLGLRTNICALPDVGLPDLERLPAAAWQVFCERSSYPTKLRELLEGSPRRVLTVPAPYGLKRTHDCLSAIAAATGRERRFRAVWGRALAGVQPEWDRLRKEAAGCRLAFVVSEATLPRLLQLRYGHGAPLGEMVQEMGFGIDLLYYDIHGEAPKLPEGLAGAQVAVFRSPWELERALAAGGFQAVFSDIMFDWRIARAGKARFSSRDFELGLAGALRTFRRLLTRCRLPFYRRYAENLARGPRTPDALQDQA
ncbi:MAG: hypothetical protein NTY77_14600 [Elusimicrobia bacterium]|nr:hypothetical protein [Elusimicrobiota bacterium]